MAVNETPTTLYNLAYHQVQKSSNFLPAFFGGFLLGLQTNSPVYILKISQTPDLTLPTKAIARLGLESAYWYTLAKRIVQEGFNAAQSFNMFMPCVIATPDGQTSLLTSLDQNQPYCVRLGNKNKFYESMLDKVVVVDTLKGEEKIPVADLGMADGAIIIKSRKQIVDAARDQFFRLFQKLLKEKEDLQILIRQYNLTELVKLIDSRETFTQYWEQGQISGDMYYFVLESMDSAIREEIRAEGLGHELVRAISAHAVNLTRVYYQAQEDGSKKGVYPYSMSPVDRSVLLPPQTKTPKPS